MKSNPNDQLNRGKTGDRSNQKPPKTGGKKIVDPNKDPVKKGDKDEEIQYPEVPEGEEWNDEVAGDAID